MLSKNFKIEYGIDTNKIDITDVLSKRTTKQGISHIPKGDETRASIFGDPSYGSYKKIFITCEQDENDTTDEYNYTIERDHDIYIDFKNSKLYIDEKPPLQLEQYNLCIMAIFKNETMNLRIWLEHYLWQGVDHFILLIMGAQTNL
jgi:hypothetical protein